MNDLKTEQPVVHAPEMILKNSELLLLYSENPRGEPLTWGTTPLIMNEETRVQQATVHDSNDRLFQGEMVPAHVSAGVRAFAEHVDMSRRHHRESKNRDGKRNASLWPSYRRTCSNAKGNTRSYRHAWR